MNQPYHPAIIFDVGGVLLDWNPRYLYRKFFPGDPAAMETFLADVHFQDWNEQMDAGRPFRETVPELCARFPAYAHLIRAFDERWEETLAGSIPGTVAILADLKQAGYPLYALTNYSREKFQITWKKHTFLTWFEDIVVSAEARMIKPDPRIFQLLLERIGRPAGECLYIDDAAHNIVAAEQLGFQAIQFHSPQQLRTELDRRGIG